MILPTTKNFVFDLDDTLYSEYDFEKSGIEFVYKFFDIKHIELEFILNNRKNWIAQIINSSNTKIKFQLALELYRNHIPSIKLYKDASLFLEKLNYHGSDMSLITDGRSITQRNKLKSLGINSYFKHIVISEEVNSEKPNELNYRLVMGKNRSDNFIYFADNPNKDFITPNRLGWTTICLLNRGQNVHSQNFNKSKDFLPQYVIKTFDEIILNNEK